MKKTIKLVLIFFGSLVGVIAGSLTGYLLISQNKTYYIYDVRLVQPVDGMSGYIYTDRNASYTPMDNQTVYMNSAGGNLCPIAVYAASSTNSKEVTITSSDTSVAKIVYRNGKCFVQYIKEGIATISSEMKGVSDSFTIQIYDQIPSDFKVYDYAYYGEKYAEYFPNTIVCYADNQEYRYSYFLNNISQTGSNTNVDGDLIRTDETNIDKNVFLKAEIDSLTNELVVCCKKPTGTQTQNIDSTIVLQSFYKTEDGRTVIENNYIVHVHVILYIPEFLQIEVSSSPDFDEKMVFTDTVPVDINAYTPAEIQANPSLLDEYLKYAKAENHLTKRHEHSTYNVYLNERVQKLYIKCRMVFTNGDVVYLNGENASITFSNATYCELGPTGEYYIMTLDTTNYFTSPLITSFNVTISLNDYVFTSDPFVFEYKSMVAENVEDFYDYNAATGVYTFKYWDERARWFNYEYYNENGDVIGFIFGA